MEKNKKYSDGFFSIRTQVNPIYAVFLGSIPILAILFVWVYLTKGYPVETRIISPTILPSPMEVMDSFKELWFERELSINAVFSIRRVLYGFLIAAAISVPLGVLMGTFSKINAMFNPLSVIGGYLPIAALVPLTLSWFGIGEFQKIMFLAIATFLYLLPLIVKSVNDVDDIFVNTALTLGANKIQILIKVLLSISLFDIYNSLRLAFGVGWTYIILAEMVDAKKGLGQLILSSQRIGPREHIYLVLIAIILIGFVIDKLWESGGKLLFSYKER
jgi:NitT/TauT family transport system permease protein